LQNEIFCSDQGGGDSKGRPSCEGQWWRATDPLNGNNHFLETFGPNTSVTLDFTGTSLTLVAFVRGNGGAIGIATVDNDHMAILNFTAPDGVDRAGTNLYQVQGLNATAHTFTLKYDDSSFGEANARRRMAVDGIMIANSSSQSKSNGPSNKGGSNGGSSSDNKGSSTSTSTPAAASTTDAAPKTSKISPGELVGIAVGLTLGVLLVGLVIIFAYLRRRNRRRKLAPSRDFMMLRSQYPFFQGRSRPSDRETVADVEFSRPESAWIRPSRVPGDY